MSDLPLRPRARRFVPLALLLAGGALFFVLGGGRYLSFSALADNRAWLLAQVAKAGATAALTYILVYAGLVALSVPGAVLLTMTGGFLFGPVLGGTYAVIAATIGATAVFLAARAGLAGLLRRAGPYVRRLEAGFRHNSFLYMVVLRLMPLIPFWLVNLVAGVLELRVLVFMAATLVGIAPGTFIYASLGSGLGGVIAQGHPPGLAVLTRPIILLPLLALAAGALLPLAYRYWRRRGGREPL